MTNSRRTLSLVLSALALVLLASGCVNLTGDSYPSRQDLEQSILQNAAFPPKGQPNKDAGVRLRSVDCVEDTGVKSRSRFRCLAIASDGTRFGSEVVVEPDGRWIMTPGWVDAGRLVTTGKAED